MSCMSWFPHSQVSRRDGMEAADIRMLAVGYASGKVCLCVSAADHFIVDFGLCWALVVGCSAFFAFDG